MRPKALKANRTLTPLEVAELLDVLLGAATLEVLVDELGWGVEVGVVDEGVRVTPCVE